MLQRKRELLDWCLNNLKDWPYDVLEAPGLRGAQFMRNSPRAMPVLIAQDGTKVTCTDFFYARKARRGRVCQTQM